MNLDELKAGQQVTCTLKVQLQEGDVRNTITRLMRFDPDIKRALKKSQEHRSRTLHVRIRGGRPWVDRKKAAKVAVPIQGASWTMTWFPHIKQDLQAVQKYLDISAA